MYSLASASILAIDLARHPNGASVADVLDRLLCLTEAETALLVDPAPDEARSWAVAYPGEDTVCGGLEGLHALVRLLLHDAPAPARVVAQDAVTATWSAPWAPASVVRALRAPWDRVVGDLPTVLPDTAYRAELEELLEQVVRRQPEQWESVSCAHARHRGTLRWSTLMHASCRAAVAAGRDRDVARAHLAAARAIASAQLGGEARMTAGMAVTAAVQALCTRDLLDTAELHESWLAGS